jgi:hypothetical protein
MHVPQPTHSAGARRKSPPRAWRTACLAALGVVVAVVVFALFLLVAQPGEAPDAGGAYQYARSHVTLYGKMAALSHHDVLKTTEPLTCSDGVQNFTCLLSKTDITPVLRELKKIDVEPEVSPVARRWVLVLDFNYTEGSWRWRNVTVVRGWELKWNNETTYVFQAQIKKSLGEIIKIQKEVSRRLLVEKVLKGVIGVVLDKIVVTTENATATPWVCHIGGDIVCFGGVAEVTGSVWGPCNYTGAVEIIDGPPIDWWAYSFECVAAGRAGGKTYAVFIREAVADTLTGDPFKSEAERDLCYCAKKRIVPCKLAKTLAAYMPVGILVADVEEGVGYLSIGYGMRPYHLNHSRFIFGDGVYLNIEGFETLRYMGGLKAAVGAKREIMGPLLEGCAYRVKVKLEPEKLTISQPLYNTTARAVRVG